MSKKVLEPHLIKAINQSKIRLLPAIERQRKNNPIKEFFFQYFRIFSPLGEIPFSVDKNYRFFLDGMVNPNSKTGNVFREITNAGINNDQIWHNSLRPYSGLSRLLRVLFRLPWLFVIFTKNRKVFTSFDLVALQVFVGYEAYKRFFAGHRRLIPIINSDISPTLHMQWSAAIAVKRKVFWWQDDYHHYTGFSAENYMPYSCTFAAVLNQKGFETVLQKNPNANVFARPQTPVKPFKSIPPNPSLGVATNAFFEASSSQLQFINEIRESLGAPDVQFRLHPNTKLTPQDFKESWMRITPTDESIERYCEKVDMVVVGNSGVQLKLLCAGIPVVHTQVLDNFGYDLYGYCDNGFCYGIEDFDQLVSIEEINRFYQSTELQEKLKGFVNVREKLPGLSALKYEGKIHI